MAKKKPRLDYKQLVARKSWSPLPVIVAMTGPAKFLKSLIAKRFAREVFGAEEPDIRRFDGSKSGGAELKLAAILDELRTPSFFSSSRLVEIRGADTFVASHGDALTPYLDIGFSGGYLLLDLDDKLDMRRRFPKQVNESGWLVECLNPFDRPPPWERHTPVWNSELSHWLSARASEKGLKLSAQVAFSLHFRAGTDLAVLDQELDKLKTYIDSKQRAEVTEADVDAIRARWLPWMQRLLPGVESQPA